MRPLPRHPEDVILMLAKLNQMRDEAMNNNMVSVALAIGSQISMLKWAYQLNDKEPR